MDNHFDTRIIIEHLNHNSDEEQKAALYEWMAADEANVEEYFRIKRIWMLRNSNLHSGETEVELALKQFNLNIDKKENRLTIKKLYRLSASVAAMLMLGILFYLGSYYLENSREEWFTFTTSISGDVEEILLEDGTKVYLNSGSEISFKKKFITGTDTREVKLKGEAYFDVKRDVLRPFRVKIDKIYINVLGTAFNIKSDGTIEAVLEKGSISLEDSKGNLLAQLSPGEMAVYNNDTEKLEITKTNTAQHTSWRFSQSVFENISFPELISLIEERYDVKVILQSDLLEKKRFRFIIHKNESVEDVMNTLKYIAPIEYYFATPTSILIREAKD